MKSRTKGTITIEAQSYSFGGFVDKMKFYLSDIITMQEPTMHVADALYSINEADMEFSAETDKPFDEMLKHLKLGKLYNCPVDFRLVFSYASFDPETERLYTERVLFTHPHNDPTMQCEQLDYDEPILTGEALTDGFELYRPDEILQLGDAAQLKRFMGSNADGISENALEAYSYEMDGHFLFQCKIPEAVKYMNHS